MTIAVGMIANGGVVLAADTQLTVQNYWKGEGGKFIGLSIGKRNKPSGACVITGATSLYDFLHAVGDQIRHDFESTLDDADKDTAFERFEGIIHDFHFRHVAPEPDHPEVSVLVGYQRNGELALWQSTRSVLVEQPYYGAVGVGSFAALAWLKHVHKGTMDLPASIVLATFAVAVAKESVDGCGKYTNVFVVEADSYRWIPQSVVNEIDALYESLSVEVQPDFVLDCLGEDLTRKRKVSRDDLMRQIGEITTRLRESTPESTKQWRRERWARLRDEADRKPSTATSSDQPPSPESPGVSDES
jgi:hypothetical protein